MLLRRRGDILSVVHHERLKDDIWTVIVEGLIKNTIEE
jgi:hypothetical protein